MELTEQVKLLKAAVLDLAENHQIGMDYANRPALSLPEDPAVLALCEKWGFGAVMDSVARQWFKRDPKGCHITGPCYLVAQSGLSRAAAALGNESKL